MTVEVRSVEDGDAWNDWVDRSADASAFHRYEALEVQATHADARLHTLAGHVGQEVVGLLPVFERTKGPFRGVFSPPPYLWVPSLGPVLLNVAKLKQRKRERRHRRFVEGCLDWLDHEVSPHYARIRTGDGYEDVRPFVWRDWTATPEYTYVVDLSVGEDELLKRFSRGVRNDIRSVDESAYTVEEGDGGDARRIIEQVQRRYAAQGEPYEVTPAFVAALYERLPEGMVRPYVLRIEGRFVTGVVVVESDERAYRWQGGTKHDADLPANDLLDWHVMCDAMERGRTELDLVGAGNRRINRYKTKFNPELRPFYTLEGGRLKPLADLYTRLRPK